MDEFREAMLVAAEVNPDVTVMVRADEGIQYGKVVDVLKILNKAKLTRMALVTEEE